MSGPEDRDPEEGRGFVRVGVPWKEIIRDLGKRLLHGRKPPDPVETEARRRCRERGYHLSPARSPGHPPNEERFCLTCGTDVTRRM